MRAARLIVVLAVLNSALGAIALRAGGQAHKQQGMGSIAGVIRNFQGDPWPDLGLAFYVFNGEAAILQGDVCTKCGVAEGRITTDDTGKYRFDLPAGPHVMTLEVLSAIHARFAVLTFVVFPGVVTPGNVNLKTEALNSRILVTHLAAGQSDLDRVESLRGQINEASGGQRDVLQARLDSEATQAIGEFQQALAATDEDDSFFRRYGVLTIEP